MRSTVSVLVAETLNLLESPRKETTRENTYLSNITTKLIICNYNSSETVPYFLPILLISGIYLQACICMFVCMYIELNHFRKLWCDSDHLRQQTQPLQHSQSVSQSVSQSYTTVDPCDVGRYVPRFLKSSARADLYTTWGAWMGVWTDRSIQRPIWQGLGA